MRLRWPLGLLLLSASSWAYNPYLGGQSFKKCCEKAIDTFGYKTPEYRCGQRFIEKEVDKAIGEKEQEPAPPIYVPLKWCMKECPGWQISKATKLSQFATPFVGFILPAIVFGFVIPRRLKLEVSDGLFDYEFRFTWRDISKGVFALFGAAPLVLFDTLGWICVIFTMVGPMLLGGMHEAFIDSCVIKDLERDRLRKSEDPEKMNLTQRSQIMLMLLIGNVDQDYGGAREDGATVWKEIIAPGGRRRTMARYTAMMKSQASFGGAVGAPVLFYAGAFAYGLFEIQARLGDNDTSHSLAFGMWWIVVVHVAILSGLLLASNNPNTFEAITSQDDDEFIPEKRFGILVPAYQCRYKPAWMWYRGRQKYRWFSRSIQLGQIPGNFGELSILDWVRMLVGSWCLIAGPCLLASLTSANTPKVGFGCRSLSLLLYALSQTTLIFCYAWYGFRERRGLVVNKYVAQILNDVCDFFLRPVSILASLLAGIGGTIMQLVGIYRNCLCMVDAPGWVTGIGLVQLATDIAEGRAKAKTWWKWTGTSAIIGLTLVTYIGWSFQKQKRDRFRKQIKSLAFGSIKTSEMKPDNAEKRTDAVNESGGSSRESQQA